MKFDFNFKPADEIPASEALRPVVVNHVAATPAPFASHAPVSELGLLARRSARLARRASR